MGQISDLQLTSFRYILVGVVLVVLVVLLVTGVKQSQLLDLSLGLGLEFDNNNSSDNIFVNQNVYIIDCIFL